MVGPIVAVTGFATAGWLTGGAAGLSVGIGLGLLLTAAVAAGAAWWSQSIGSLLELEDARANAPRPPGFGPLCEWVYARTLSG